MGVLAKNDWPQLERYCVYLERWRRCEKQIAKEGMDYATEDLVKEHALLRESHRLDKALKQIEANFGLTPSARTRLTVVPGPAAEPAGGKSRFFKASS